MPELPELETFRRNFTYGTPEHPPILDEVIENSSVFWPRSLAAPGLEAYSSRIQGQTVLKIGRRGKYLIIYLDRDAVLIHLRMSGDLLLETVDTAIAPHHRLVFDFRSGRRLSFNDPRKFGRVWLVSDPQAVVGRLGPEPLEESFSAQQFWGNLKRYRRQLKPLLLDQSFLAGVGNIYADEALHRAKLNPLVQSNLVSAAQAQALLTGIRQVLRESIQHNGSSIDWVYRGGGFQEHLRVHLRAGEPCTTCSTPIEKIRVGQRSSYFCPFCQPLKETRVQK